MRSARDRCAAIDAHESLEDAEHPREVATIGQGDVLASPLQMAVVTAALAAMEEPGAVGHAFNVANARSITQADLLESFAAVQGHKARVVRMPRELILRMGGNPMGPKLYFGMYFDLPPITMMIAKAQRVLKFKPTDFSAGLKETYKWWKAEAQSKNIDYTFEDGLLERAQRGEAGT